MILIVDDDAEACELLAAGLKRRGYDALVATSGTSALQFLEHRPVDLVLADIRMSEIDGIALCQRMSEAFPDVPVIMVTGHATVEVAIAAIRAGAVDFVIKPIDLDHLVHQIERATKQRELEAEVKRLRRVLHEQSPGQPMVGESAPIRGVVSIIDRVAESQAPVLVSGESGTGKELVARALHARSQHADGPFVPVNCAALPANLLESELFGHLRGAFTDARQSREGLFRQASHGTLFLDEIGELPLAMQPKLLRAIQEHKVRPVGGEEELPYFARVISATNRDLEAAVEAGRFREDLFYRLNVVNIHVPPLRARGSDILLLAQCFLERVASRSGKEVTGLSTSAAARLLAYDWPGNVRELENCIERAVALARYSEIMVDDLPDKVRRYEHGEMVIAGDDPSELPTLEALEARYIRRVLKAVRGNKAQAARVLGLARRTLYRRLERSAANGTEFTEEEFS